MHLKILRVISFSLFLFGTGFTAVAWAQGGELGGNAQSPSQVIVQIVATGIVLKFLQYFDLP